MRDPLICRRAKGLLDFAFLILDMLAGHGIVLTDRHFLGHSTRVFLGHVEVASASGRVQTDLDCRRLRHGMSPASKRRGLSGNSL